MNYVLSTAATFQAVFANFASPITYTVHGGATHTNTLKSFVRGVRDEDLFAEALQRDQVAVVDAAKFAAVTGQETPRRLDRMVVKGQSYTVETWRGAPSSDPTFFKLLLRGGTQ